MPYSDPHIRFMDTKHSPPTPRWVRERKRFDRELGNRVELWLMELEKNTYKTFREAIDIRLSLNYTNRVIDKQFDYIRNERGFNEGI